METQSQSASVKFQSASVRGTEEEKHEELKRIAKASVERTLQIQTRFSSSLNSDTESIIQLILHKWFTTPAEMEMFTALAELAETATASAFRAQEALVKGAREMEKAYQKH
jgi:hypothetical protein